MIEAVLRIRDVYPGSKNSNKIEGWKKICCHTFFVATNLTKLNIILSAEEKIFGPVFKES